MDRSEVAIAGRLRSERWLIRNSNTKPEWKVDFEFRASGPERGGGNLQIWYTKDGRATVDTSSIYTVGKFDGLSLVVDTYGGRVSCTCQTGDWG